MKTRTQDRTKLIYRLRVFDASDGKLLGHLVDITTGGMMLIGSEPIPVGADFTLRMDLPKNVEMDGRFTVAAESSWCRKHKGGGYFSMGFRVVDIKPETVALVRRLALHFCQEEGEEDPERDMNPSLS